MLNVHLINPSSRSFTSSLRPPSVHPSQIHIIERLDLFLRRRIHHFPFLIPNSPHRLVEGVLLVLELSHFRTHRREVPRCGWAPRLKLVSLIPDTRTDP